MASSTITPDMVKDALSHVIEPELHKDLITLDMVKEVEVAGQDVQFTVMLTTPACPMKAVIQKDCEDAIKSRIPDVSTIRVNFGSQMRKDARLEGKLDLQIGNIIAVSSGKGGVGKSTFSVNLAVSLAQEGARVGLLDADVYGPNIPMMMGLSELPESKGDKLVPGFRHGVHMMSMGYLVPEGQALIWRGPMLHSTIKQLFTDVAWPELDYLIVDLPPGTGDAQLSLSQTVPLTGGVIVTSPQAVAVSDAVRGLNAFDKLQVPILGIVENMAGPVFGEGGGEKAAETLEVPFIGRIPLDAALREGGDAGEPIVVSQPESAVAKTIAEIARKIAGRVTVVLESE
jgi:ATP-binding protein involved in chromosome partitioning